MATGTIKVSQTFRLDGRPFVISKLLEGDRVQFEDLLNQRVEQKSKDDLLGAYARGALRFGLDGTDPAAIGQENKAYIHAWNGCLKREISNQEHARVAEKLRYVRELAGLALTQSYITPIIKDIWERQQLTPEGSCFARAPGFSSVSRWIKAYRESSGDHRCLVDRHELKGSRNKKLCTTALDILDASIEAVYLSPLRQSMTNVVEHANAAIRKENLQRVESERIPILGIWAVRARIAELPDFDVAVARHGRRAADVMFRGSGSGVVTSRPLQRVEIDHYRMDLFVVDQGSGLPLGRPWLTVLLDAHTRMVLGYHIGFEEPSTANTMLALRHAMTPKADFLTNFPMVKGKWDAWGVIELLVADNGLEFHGLAIERITEQFGTAVQFCPRRKPWYKGKIERFFRTVIMRLLSSIPGKTFDSIKARGDYDPSGSAILSLETLKHVVVLWIVDIYHQTRHTSLQMTPQQAWEHGVTGIQRQLPDCSTWMDAAFGRPSKRVLTHSGVEVNNLSYNSQDLQSLRMEYGTRLAVDLVLDDNDLGHVWVLNPVSREMIKVPALQLQYCLGLTKWQHGLISDARKVFSEKNQEITLSESKDRLKQLIDEDFRTTKRKQRQTQARFLEGTKTTSNSHDASARTLQEVAAGAKLDATVGFQSPAQPASDQTADTNITPLPVRRITANRRGAKL